MRKLLGIAAGLVGICLLVGVEALHGLGAALWAQFAIVAATICYAGGDLRQKLPGSRSDAAGGGIAARRYRPAAAGGARHRASLTLTPSAASLAALLALATVSTALALVVYFRLVQTLGSIGATAQSCLRVPIGVALGVLVVGERLSPAAWARLACVLAGAIATTLPARKAVSAQAS